MPEKSQIKMPGIGDVKHTLVEGVKGGVVGALSLGIGQALLGNVGQFLGACVGGAAVRGQAGVVITTYGCMDAIMDVLFGEGEI